MWPKGPFLVVVLLPSMDKSCGLVLLCSVWISKAWKAQFDKHFRACLNVRMWCQVEMMRAKKKPTEEKKAYEKLTAQRCVQHKHCQINRHTCCWGIDIYIAHHSATWGNLFNKLLWHVMQVDDRIVVVSIHWSIGVPAPTSGCYPNKATIWTLLILGGQNFQTSKNWDLFQVIFFLLCTMTNHHQTIFLQKICLTFLSIEHANPRTDAGKGPLHLLPAFSESYPFGSKGPFGSIWTHWPSIGSSWKGTWKVYWVFRLPPFHKLVNGSWN